MFLYALHKLSKCPLMFLYALHMCKALRNIKWHLDNSDSKYRS